MIPVHVLTGFLGSGKTTLLGRILRDPAMSRTAVIMNELGDIGLDHHLIERSDESLVRLTTGCICCRLRSDLTATLLDLAARVDAQDIEPFERVILETTGLADPAPILQTLLTDPELKSRFALGRIVTTVDALFGPETLERYVEARRQVAFSDAIMITKTDRADARGAETRALLHSLNARAQVVTATTDDALRLFKASPGAGRAWDVPASTGEAQHTHGVTSFSLVRRTPLQAATLPLFLSALAQNCGRSLLRVKGLVAVAECPDRPAVIHGVQHVYAQPEWLERWPETERATQLVFIGTDVPRRWVCNLLDLLEEEVAAETMRYFEGLVSPPFA